MLKEFKAFIMRGNVLDLAVGVIIGSAFTAVVTSLTTNLINPILGLFTLDGGLNTMKFTVLGATFKYGQFFTDIINFLIIAFVVFMIVKTANRFMPAPPAADEPAAPSKEEVLLAEIRDLLAHQSRP